MRKKLSFTINNFQKKVYFFYDFILNISKLAFHIFAKANRTPKSNCLAKDNSKQTITNPDIHLKMLIMNLNKKNIFLISMIIMSFFHLFIYLF